MGEHAGLLQAVVWRTQVLILPQRPAQLNKLTLNLYDKRQTSRILFFKTPFGKSGSFYQTGSASLFTKKIRINFNFFLPVMSETKTSIFLYRGPITSSVPDLGSGEWQVTTQVSIRHLHLHLRRNIFSIFHKHFEPGGWCVTNVLIRMADSIHNLVQNMKGKKNELNVFKSCLLYIISVYFPNSSLFTFWTKFLKGNMTLFILF